MRFCSGCNDRAEGLRTEGYPKSLSRLYSRAPIMGHAPTHAPRFIIPPHRLCSSAGIVHAPIQVCGRTAIHHAPPPSMSQHKIGGHAHERENAHCRGTAKSRINLTSQVPQILAKYLWVIYLRKPCSLPVHTWSLSGTYIVISQTTPTKHLCFSLFAWEQPRHINKYVCWEPVMSQNSRDMIFAGKRNPAGAP
jgi:hypothetical protein